MMNTDLKCGISRQLMAIVIVLIFASFVMLVSAVEYDVISPSGGGSNKPSDPNSGTLDSRSLGDSGSGDSRISDDNKDVKVKASIITCGVNVESCTLDEEVSGDDEESNASHITSGVTVAQKGGMHQLALIIPILDESLCSDDVPECADILISGCNVKNKDLILTETHYVDGIYVCANDRVIDCQGNRLVGDGSSTGISIEGVSRTTIKDCTIENYELGVHLKKATSSIVRVNDFLENGVGITLSGGSENVIRYNGLENNELGIEVAASSENEFSWNTFGKNQMGLTLISPSSNENTFRYNEFSQNRRDLSSKWSHSNLFAYNYFDDEVTTPYGNDFKYNRVI